MSNIKIAELNQKLIEAKAQWVAKENWLSNFSLEQKQNLLGVKIDQADLTRIQAMPLAVEAPQAGLPVKVDWRQKNGKNYISPIKNQGGCGSCVSFCTVALTEAMAAIEKGKFFLDLSEADLHFCSSHGANCGGWWPTSALDDVINRGVVDEASFPYNAAFSGGVHCIPVADRAKKITKLTSYSTLNSMAQRKQWLNDIGPLSAVFHVYEDFFGLGSGVYSHVTGTEVGYHCVEVIGYDDAQNCWICKNSWGTDFGDNGFFKIAYGQCGIDATSNDQDGSGNVIRFPMWGAKGVVLPAGLAPKIQEISSNINSDGRLEVFVRALDNGVWNIWQTVPHAGPWSNMSPMGGLVKQLASALNSDGRLEIFGIGMDNALWNDWQTHPHAGPWSGWNRLGGGVKKIAATCNSDGRLEVFAIGMDDALWHMWQTAPHAGPWSAWSSLGGKIKAVDVALNSDGRLEVFGIGMDDALWNIWQTAPHAGPWSAWNSLGGKVKAIKSACNSDGRLEVFGIGMDDALWNIWQTAPHAGPWSAWNSLGGKIKKLDAELNSDGRLEVFGIGMDDALWNIWQTKPHAGPWSGWNSLGGKIKYLSSARNSDGRLEVFGVGMDDGLWNIWQTKPAAGPWSGWNKLA